MKAAAESRNVVRCFGTGRAKRQDLEAAVKRAWPPAELCFISNAAGPGASLCYAQAQVTKRIALLTALEDITMVVDADERAKLTCLNVRNQKEHLQLFEPVCHVTLSVEGPPLKKPALPFMTCSAFQQYQQAMYILFKAVARPVLPYRHLKSAAQ